MLKDSNNINNKENLVAALSITNKISTQLTPAQIYKIVVSEYWAIFG